MKGTNRKRTLIVSAAVILLCMTVIVGMTWALFTDTHTVKNHLQAGDLDITLERIGLEKFTLNENGYFESVKYPEKDAYWNFSNSTPKDVFDIQATEKIVPLTEYTAEMKISNQSDVAFKYWLEIVTGEGPNGEKSSEKLAEQLEITVTVKNKNGTTKTTYLNNGFDVGDETNHVGVLGIGDFEDFTVKVKFADDKDQKFDNDDAKSANVYFDLLVHAVQYTEAEPVNR